MIFPPGRQVSVMANTLQTPEYLYSADIKQSQKHLLTWSLLFSALWPVLTELTGSVAGLLPWAWVWSHVPVCLELAGVQPAWMMHGEHLHHSEGSWAIRRTVLQRQRNTSKSLWSLQSEVLTRCELYWWFYQCNCSGMALPLNGKLCDGETTSFRCRWDPLSPGYQEGQR